MPAAQASEWLDLGALRAELRLAPGEEQTVMLARQIEAAVHWVECATRLVLLGRTLELDLDGMWVHRPLLLGAEPAIAMLAGVTEVRYWTTSQFYGEPPQALERAKAGGGTEPDVGRLERFREGAWSRERKWEPRKGSPFVWRLWPRPSGWPADVRKYRITLLQGLEPSEHQDVAQVLAMVVRSYYDGTMNEEQIQFINRTLAPDATTPYLQPFLGLAQTPAGAR